MNTRCIFFALGVACPTLCAQAQLLTIEPDNYTNRTVLNNIIPGVTLITAGANNIPFPFDVTANTDNFGYAPTGDKVFGHANVGFWNNDRRLRMDFSSPIAFLSIDFGGGDSFNTERGQLDLYDSANNLLASYITQPRLGGQFETMNLSRPTADIAWAVAYEPGATTFGRLDHLVFSPVPEPSTLFLGFLSATAFGFLVRHKRRGERQN